MDFRQFENMGPADRREIMRVLKATHGNMHWQAVRDKRDKKQKELDAKRKKLDDFINSLNVSRYTKRWEKDHAPITVVSLEYIEDAHHRIDYNQALESIRKGFEEINRIKGIYLKLCESENQPLSKYFYTTESRMSREKLRVKKVAESDAKRYDHWKAVEGNYDDNGRCKPRSRASCNENLEDVFNNITK